MSRQIGCSALSPHLLNPAFNRTNCCNQAWLLKNSLFAPNMQNLGDGKCLGDPRTSLVGLPNAILFLRFSREGVFQQPQTFALKISLGADRLNTHLLEILERFLS